jgi:hypothetical protein
MSFVIRKTDGKGTAFRCSRDGMSFWSSDASEAVIFHSKDEAKAFESRGQVIPLHQARSNFPLGQGTLAKRHVT